MSLSFNSNDRKWDYNDKRTEHRADKHECNVHESCDESLQRQHRLLCDRTDNRLVQFCRSSQNTNNEENRLHETRLEPA